MKTKSLAQVNYSPVTANQDVFLSVNDLMCERDEHCLFSGLNFSLKASEVLHITGANGSGKTSLLRILCGLMEPNAGSVNWQGKSIKQAYAEYLANVIFIGHKTYLKSGLSVRENLELQLALHTLAPAMHIENVLQALNLAGYDDVMAQQLSAGQQQRVALARLLLFPAQLWILDEPFTALDVKGIKLLEDLIIEHLARQGMVVLTSHQALHLNNIPITNIHLAQGRF